MKLIFRIGAGAGFSGDRIEPAIDLAERGQLDALVFECVAERTIASAQLRRQHDPNAGYDPLLQARMRAVLPACVRNRVTIITNMGAAHPLAAGHAVLAVARELKLDRLRIAVVLGDDVLPWLREQGQMIHFTEHASAIRTGSQGVSPVDAVSANAYLGADALLPALQGGADVVITGRVADPALFLAPLMHHFAWGPDDWARLGCGLAVGHVLECAGQVSGGYIAEPGHLDVPDLAHLGFPLAEVDAEGDAVITKLAGTGGRVDRLTCTAQLLYEIEDPARYLQPDVVGDFSAVRLAAIGQDRVAMSGASGSARPAQLKVSVGVREGFIGEGQISYGGLGARARGELALQVLRVRLQQVMGDVDEADVRAELIGVNALHGDCTASPGDLIAPNEVRVRLAVRCATRAQAERIGDEVEALYLNGPAAGGGVTRSVREVLAVGSCLIPREAVQPFVQWLQWTA